MEISDKTIHCIARTMQSGENSCLYCKYAFECRDAAISAHEAALSEIEKKTGIIIELSPRNAPIEILAGSWIEQVPELRDKFTSLSLLEQQDILMGPDTLKYEGIHERSIT